MRTRGFVGALKKKGYTKGISLRMFFRQYTAASQYLVKNNLLEGYTQAILISWGWRDCSEKGGEFEAFKI